MRPCEPFKKWREEIQFNDGGHLHISIVVGNSIDLYLSSFCCVYSIFTFRGSWRTERFIWASTLRFLSTEIEERKKKGILNTFQTSSKTNTTMCVHPIQSDSRGLKKWDFSYVFYKRLCFSAVFVLHIYSMHFALYQLERENSWIRTLTQSRE